MALRRTPQLQRLIQPVLAAVDRQGLLTASTAFVAAVAEGKAADADAICMEEGGITVLRILVSTPVGCPLPFAAMACMLIAGSTPAWDPDDMQNDVPHKLQRAGILPSIVAIFMSDDHAPVPEGLPAFGGMSAAAIAAGALNVLLLNNLDACNQVLSVEGYLSHVCQLLTGNASDMDARVSAAAHIAVIADSFWAAGEPVPRQLLPAVQPLVRILLSQQGRRTIPESISGPSLASAMMVLSQLAVLKDFAPELVWCGAVRGAIPFITYAAQENDDLTLTTSSMTIIVKLLEVCTGGDQETVAAQLLQGGALPRFAELLLRTRAESSPLERLAGPRLALEALHLLSRRSQEYRQACLAAGVVEACTTVLRRACTAFADTQPEDQLAYDEQTELTTGAAATLGVLLDEAEAASAAVTAGLPVVLTMLLQAPLTPNCMLQVVTTMLLLVRRGPAGTAACVAAGALPLIHAKLHWPPQPPASPGDVRGQMAMEAAMLVLKIHDISALAKGHPAAAQEALSPMSSAPHRQHDAWTRTLSHAELGPHGSFRLWLFASATHFQVTLASSADDWRFCNLQVNVTYVAQWLDVTAHRPLLEGSINPLLQFLVVSLHFLNQVASTAAESASTEASAKARLLASPEALAAIVRVLRRLRSSQEDLQAVCMVLIQLVDDDPATQHAVSAAEGLQAALSLLRKRDAAAETVARAAALVRKLCGGNAANQAAFTSAGGLDAAMLQLSKCQGTQVDGGTMVALLQLLGELSVASEAFRKAAVAAGAPAAAEAAARRMPAAGTPLPQGGVASGKGKGIVREALRQLQGGGGGGGS